MYRVQKTTERFSFQRLGSTSSFWTWLFYAWNTRDINEEWNNIHHTGVRIAGCRHDKWEVMPNAKLT